MTVYVDECVLWLPRQPRPFHNGSSHLTATDEGELHTFARRLGLKRGWFQYRAIGGSHYDLTPARREKAIQMGALFVPAREQARTRILARRLVPA